jgi:hypothetical protein
MLTEVPVAGSQGIGPHVATGVREYRIVKPGERQIEFLVNESGRFVVVSPEGGEYRSPAFEEIRLDLGGFWHLVDARLPR